jgi:hypothetical protein
LPWEAIELELVEMFHCKPSELEGEDGFTCLRLLNMRHWRDAASAYKHNRKGMDGEDRMRIGLLLSGKVPDALTKSLDKKKTKIDEAKEFIDELGQPPKKTPAETKRA